MLHIDPYQRPTALEILLSPWIKHRDKFPTATLDRTHWQKTNEIKVSLINNGTFFKSAAIKMISFDFR